MDMSPFFPIGVYGFLFLGVFICARYKTFVELNLL